MGSPLHMVRKLHKLQCNLGILGHLKMVQPPHILILLIYLPVELETRCPDTPWAQLAEFTLRFLLLFVLKERFLTEWLSWGAGAIPLASQTHFCYSDLG